MSRRKMNMKLYERRCIAFRSRITYLAPLQHPMFHSFLTLTCSRGGKATGDEVAGRMVVARSEKRRVTSRHTRICWRATRRYRTS